MTSIHVALIQANLHWEDKAANFSMFEERLKSLKQPCDLVILPEMYSTGFTMNPGLLAEKMDGRTVNWMLHIAQTHQTAITGSLIVEEDGQFYNRMIWLTPEGRMQYYDKRHLFGMGGENRSYHSGKERKIVSYKGFKFCLTVCYDLRFPVWNRNLDDYDILVNVANWPATRISHWQTLLRARAIENMVYVLAVNRTGVDDNGLKYTGNSAIIRFDGSPIEEKSGVECILRAELNKNELQTYREKLPFLGDADHFVFKS